MKKLIYFILLVVCSSSHLSIHPAQKKLLIYEASELPSDINGYLTSLGFPFVSGGKLYENPDVFVAYFGKNEYGEEAYIECKANKCELTVLVDSEAAQGPIYKRLKGYNTQWQDQIKELVEKYQKSKASK